MTSKIRIATGWTVSRPRIYRRASRRFRAQVAQLVEHVTENHGVGGSIPSLGTIIPQEAGIGPRQTSRSVHPTNHRLFRGAVVGEAGVQSID